MDATFFKLEHLIQPRHPNRALQLHRHFPHAPRGKDVYGGPPLDYDFYTTMSPSFQQIVKSEVAKAMLADSLTPAQLLRLFFHDCFVMGCDASLLLKSTVLNLAERDHPSNFTVDKFSVIDAIKAELEKACPGIVSCADIVGAAAVEAVEQAGGPHIDLAYGRRDGLDSFGQAAKTNLPGSTLQVEGLRENFANVGLNLTDMVVLSGGHTIGQARCSSFADRFAPAAKNPFPDTIFGQELNAYCVEGNRLGIDRRMTLDANSTTIFDNGYFQSIVAGRGILTTDNVLFTDNRTKSLVTTFAQDQTVFFDAFKELMAKMGRIGVLTGTQGQIRKQCWVRNPIDPATTPDANMEFAPASLEFCTPNPCPATCSSNTA
ncbi:peroxidase P7 [Physcomitrium patens]|uniref:Peroxidase n=1 Tax=Physcomitrium patens TaxID=3218 RepID=A0A2K1IC39_PHYPA|nr:peroxidase 66-like [Physcomitrium patens]XP_024366390.1 peroxidase 66-like [Physcomitrium patens]PNR26824.1 hypothetical protein PHYPA_030305 [Physcomitrium patens]|eukprot:XP_024366389.1 peroxidase 66-like [Physcomitrella patens]